MRNLPPICVLARRKAGHAVLQAGNLGGAVVLFLREELGGAPEGWVNSPASTRITDSFIMSMSNFTIH
jgi:hypothetical protein